ncbi:MAG TPA: TonB-dependent receptor [Vicinamibacterales bacterium]|nr:TonB-dependent receptor [Vicinamibacterales bacterium]
MSTTRTSHVGRWRPAVTFLAAIAAVLSVDVASARAQGQTGTISGVVRDASGGVLPGVTVEASSPALIEKARSVVTDGQGAYSIIDLRPGTYTVTFSLAGFATVRREDINLTASFTANVNADLRVGALEETITVSAATPIVDVQNVAKISTTSREVMDVLPTDRNFVSFAALTPSVLVTGVRQNVGGSIPETGMNLVVHGSRAGDSLIMMDGMPIINGSGSGGLQYGNYLNNALAQEITFQTDSHNAEFERASVYSNFIPKEGSNTYRGSFAARYAGEGWQSANLDDEQRSKGLLTGNKINRIWDLNPALGGPILKDRVWIYGSYRHWGTYNTVAGSFKDQDFTEIFYQPSTEQNLFPVWHQSAAARLTTQINQKNKVNLYYDWQYTYFGNCFVPTYLTAISACPEYKNIPQYIVQASWSSPVTNKLLLEAGATVTPQDFHGYRRVGIPLTQFQIQDQLAPAGYPTLWGSAGTSYGANRSTQSNYRAGVSYVTGSHNMKAGFTLMHAWRYATQEPANSVNLVMRAGVPFSLTQFATPIQFHETMNYNAGLYAQDQWRLRRLTMNYGVRLDMLKATVDEQSIGAGPFTPARDFGKIENVPNWRDIDPRFGVSYDLFGDGKTAIKGSIGRYVVADAYTIARAVNPVQSTVNSVTRTWAPPAGVAYAGTYNPFDDCDLTNPAANTKRPGAVSCGAINNPLFGQVATRTTNYDPEIVEGWHVRPNNWEMQFSIQRELVPRVSVYAGYSRRWYGNLFATRNLNVTNADFTQYCIPVPADNRLDNGGTQQCGYYDINRVIPPNNLIFNSSKIGGISDVYDGFDFDAQARLGARILLSGGVSIGRERVNTCNLVNDLSLTQTGNARTQDPRTDEFCNVTPPWAPLVKGQASYPLPWDISVSATFQGLLGPELRAQYPLTNPIAAPSLGRNFTNVPPTVDLQPAGSLYGDRVYQTDLRFSKQIRRGTTTIRPTVSIYNLFNANPVQTYVTTYGATWLNPTVIMQARFVDIGIQVDF